MLPRRLLERIWNPLSRSRRGQCLGIVLIGAVVGLFSSLEWSRIPLGRRLMYGALGGVWVGCFAILVLVVPGIHLEFIQSREARGKPARMHRIVRVLYFVAFVPGIFLASIIYLVDHLPR